MLLTHKPFRGAHCIQMVICLFSLSLFLLLFLPSEWFVFLVNIFAICSLTESSLYFKKKKRKKAPVFCKGTVILTWCYLNLKMASFILPLSDPNYPFKSIDRKWKCETGSEVCLPIVCLFLGKYEQMFIHLRHGTDDRPKKRFHPSLA